MLFVETVMNNFKEFENEILKRNLSPLKTLEIYSDKYVVYKLILNELSRECYQDLILKEDATKYPLNHIYNIYIEYEESSSEYNLDNIVNAIDDFMMENCVEDNEE